MRFPSAYSELRILPGVNFLRRGRDKKPVLAILAVAMGTLILMVKILPASFWWFMIAVGLISLGIWLLRAC